MENVNCNLCGENDYKTFKVFSYNYKLVKCNNCGLVYLNPRPKEEEMSEEYNENYHIDKILQSLPSGKKEINDKINKNLGRINEINKLKENINNRKILDIGCGAGFFLAGMKRSGWKVRGIEISDWAKNYAEEVLKLEVEYSSIEEADYKEKFDVITMFHVLEHLPDPSDSLLKISKFLKKDGLLFIKGPNFGSFDRMWHGKKWKGYLDKTHLYYFNIESYKNILIKNNFSISEVKPQNWNPFFHILEIFSGDGLKADHPSGFVQNRYQKLINNPIIKVLNKMLLIFPYIFNIKGRDVTIIAKKRS